MIAEVAVNDDRKTTFDKDEIKNGVVAGNFMSSLELFV